MLGFDISPEEVEARSYLEERGIDSTKKEVVDSIDQPIRDRNLDEKRRRKKKTECMTNLLIKEIEKMILKEAGNGTARHHAR